jgi:hypothetical protein
MVVPLRDLSRVHIHAGCVGCVGHMHIVDCCS